MDEATLTMHEHIIRGLRAIVAAYEHWVRQQRAASDARIGGCPKREGKALQ